MTDIQLKKLKRVELLELLVEQGEELERTRERLQKAEEALASRQLRMQTAGTMAEAALTLNNVFAAADQAAKDSGVEDTAVNLVLLAESHDTRYDAYGVLRPLTGTH